MKAVILCAGEGRRLEPLTEGRPKPLIPIAGYPILHHLLVAFRQNGIEEFLLVVGYQKNLIQAEIEHSKFQYGKVRFIEQKHRLGTAHALNQVNNFVGQSPFILAYGDLIVKNRALRRFFQKSSADGLSIAVDRSPKSGLGIVEVKRGAVRKITEKPIRAVKRGYGNVGLYRLDPSIFEAISKTRLSERGEYELTASLQSLAEHGSRITAVFFTDSEWIHISRPWDLLQANRDILSEGRRKLEGEIESRVTVKGPCTIEKGAKVLSGSYLEGPLFIGESSIVGPNSHIRAYSSIGKNVRIGNGCEIKNSIVMDGTRIPHLSYIGDSIIGRGCNLGAGTITANLRFDEEVIHSRINREKLDTGMRKLGVIMGDNVKTGVNVSIMPGTIIGSDSWIAPGLTVQGHVKPNSRVGLKRR